MIRAGNESFFTNRGISPPFCPSRPTNKKAKNPSSETENYYTKYTDSCKLENFNDVQEKILHETTSCKMKDFMHCFRCPFFHLSARSKDKELLYCYQNILAICQRKG
ncbi:MAG: hypothetical protein PUI07_09095 [Clostridiales bacterium]|nr:hypothetical protein [Clostridiales bacterium]